MYLSRVDGSSSREREKRGARLGAQPSTRLGQNGGVAGEERMREKWKGI